MPFIPYLSFQGQCAEAFAFYGRVFGATPQTHAFADMPADSGAPPLPPEQQGWLMHAQIDKSANRLTMGIVTGCLIIGSSIVMTVQAGPTMFGLPLFGFLGFMAAFFNSIWIILSIWRAGKDYQ